MTFTEKTMDEKQNKHRMNVADIVTFFRIVGTILLVVPKPLSEGFFLLYALTGLTDVLDGWIARKTNTAGNFGASLDSLADLLFYTVMLFRVFPTLWNTLPDSIWYAVAMAASLEELIIHICSKDYCSNVKSIFISKRYFAL